MSESSASTPHSVLSDVRDALAAPRGDAGVEARMLALDSVQGLIEQLEALRFSAARYHETQSEVNALAQQLAHEWGWPDRESVLERLRGDRTTALLTFTDDAYLAFLGTSNPASVGGRAAGGQRHAESGGRHERRGACGMRIGSCHECGKTVKLRRDGTAWKHAPLPGGRKDRMGNCRGSGIEATAKREYDSDASNQDRAREVVDPASTPDESK